MTSLPSLDCAPLVLDNTGSTARDFVMLERNMLSHLKLALLLSVLSTSILLQSRLVPDDSPGAEPARFGVPIASLLFAGTLLAIVAGTWEYYHGFKY